MPYRYEWKSWKDEDEMDLLGDDKQNVEAIKILERDMKIIEELKKKNEKLKKINKLIRKLASYLIIMLNNEMLEGWDAEAVIKDAARLNQINEDDLDMQIDVISDIIERWCKYGISKKENQ